MRDVVIDYAPRPYFHAYHERHQRFSCIVAHRRAGKTTACIHDLQRGAVLCGLERPRFAYVAPLRDQAKKVAWDMLKAAALPLLQHGAVINESELRVDYPNGGQVRLYGADNPDAMRGIYLDGVVLDEPADIKPTLWPEVIRPALADRKGWATFIGTPKGRDAFYAVWRTAQTKADWLSLRLRASETLAIDPDELAAARAIMSEAQYAREFECSFDEPDVDQFIDTDTIEAARLRQGSATGPRVLGVDVARYGDDRTVLLFRNGDQVLDEDIRTYRGLDLMQTAARVAEAIEEYKPQATFVDGVGVGGGVVDRLRQLGYKVIDVNAGSAAMRDDRYSNSRAEMWGRMRDWLKDRGAIPPRDDLADDLSAPSYEHDHRNRLKLERKEDMKSRGLPSPDIGDALALTFSRPIAAQPNIGLQWKGPRSRQAAYDPLAGW